LLDVKRAIEILKKYFPHWRDLGDHCLDAQALNEVSKVIKLQNSQLRFQSSSLYADPEFLENKFENASPEKLAEIFVQSWHPIVELEQLTLPAMKEALNYWRNLLPIEERFKRLEMGKTSQPSTLNVEDLLKLGVATSKEFAGALEEVWGEMRRQSASDGKVNYWKFICCEGRSEIIRRAYYVSFLVTYGYASLAIENGQIFLIPHEAQRLEKDRPLASFPISIKVNKFLKAERSVE
jgi:hypothetical protein